MIVSVSNCQKIYSVDELALDKDDRILYPCGCSRGGSPTFMCDDVMFPGIIKIIENEKTSIRLRTGYGLILGAYINFTVKLKSHPNYKYRNGYFIHRGTLIEYLEN